MSCGPSSPPLLIVEYFAYLLQVPFRFFLGGEIHIASPFFKVGISQTIGFKSSQTIVFTDYPCILCYLHLMAAHERLRFRVSLACCFGGPVDLMIFFWQKIGTKKISTDIMTHQARIDKNNDMFGYFWKLQLYQLEFGVVFFCWGALVAEVLLAAIFLTVFYCPLVGSAPSAPSIPLGAEGAEIPHLPN